MSGGVVGREAATRDMVEAVGREGGATDHVGVVGCTPPPGADLLIICGKK